MDRTIETLAFESEQISRFRIVERLGSGAMGVVYRARDTMLQRDVALKMILPELADSPRSRARFLRECQTAASINHPGIATIYEAGETEEGSLYLASELVTGEVLSERIARGSLPPDEAIGLGAQLAEALASAHATGVVHRDIKPANLMVTEDGRLKVLDFGLARLLAGAEEESGDKGATAVTREGLVVGTPAYMSPEQAAGMKVDARTDIFAAGCVIYEMLSGNSPFRSDSVPETIRRIMCEAPPALSSSDIRLPGGVEEIVGLAIAKERDDRYQSADELAVALREVESSVRGGTAVSMRRGWRRWALRAAVGLVLLVVVAVLARSRFWERPALAFHMRDQILITGIDNQTGDEAFDLALRTALEADLQQSPYARVFDQSQVADTLRLMRKDPSSVVGETLGRDVCRFAGVRAMLMPRILSVGAAFELPPGAPRRHTLRSPWAEDAQDPPRHADAGAPLILRLKPFETLVLEAAPELFRERAVHGIPPDERPDEERKGPARPETRPAAPEQPPAQFIQMCEKFPEIR